MNKWHKLATFFEDGDLTPLAVLVSIAHYGPVLVAHGENVIVAWSVGALIDLLHFRTVRRLFRAKGNRAIVGYALIALLTTFMAAGYHYRFYQGDWLLALPIPLGIAVLAQHAASKRQEETDGLQAAVNEAQAETKSWQEKHKTAQESIKGLQEQIKEQQEIIKAWQTMNKEAQALVRFNAKLITAEQAASMIGVKDVRTVQTRAEKLNGVVKV